MIATVTLALAALTITGQTNVSNSVYDYQMSLNNPNVGQILAYRCAGNNGLCYVQTNFNLNFKCTFDTSANDSYRLSNFRLLVTSSCYWVGSDGNYYLDDSVTYSYNASWEITPSSYNQEFENTQFVIVVNEDDLTINHYYDSVLVDNATTTLEDTALPSLNTLTVNLSSNRFFSSIQSLLTLSSNAYDTGYSVGHAEGYVDGQDNQMNPEMFTIFNGILNVALVPINVLLTIFNFEVFGINIASSVSAILSICILVIVIRLVLGSKADGD